MQFMQKAVPFVFLTEYFTRNENEINGKNVFTIFHDGPQMHQI